MFIEPHINITKLHSEYNHYSNLSKKQLIERWETSIGQDLISILLKHRFNRHILINHIGRLSGKLDLRGIPLYDSDISKTDLRYINFSYSDLSACDFSYCNMSYSQLLNCDIQDTKFKFTIFGYR